MGSNGDAASDDDGRVTAAGTAATGAAAETGTGTGARASEEGETPGADAGAGNGVPTEVTGFSLST